MVKRGHRVNGPQASEGEAQHGAFCWTGVSVKEISVCIVDDTGKIVREVKVASKPEATKILQRRDWSHRSRWRRFGLITCPLKQTHPAFMRTRSTPCTADRPR